MRVEYPISFIVDYIKRDRNLGAKLATLGMAVGLVGAIIVNVQIAQGYLAIIRGITAGLMFCIWGCIGIVWIVRQEAPQLITIRGIPAIIMGFALAVFSWGFGVYFLAATMLKVLNGGVR